MSKIRLSESQLLGMIQESVERLVKEYAYHERQHKPTPEEHEAWIKKMSAAKKAYYDNLRKKEGDNGKEKSKYIDYYQYKHGEHPAMNLKEANTIVKLNESQLKNIVAESVKKVLAEINCTGRSYPTVKAAYDKMK